MALDIPALVARVQKLRPVRVFTRYATQRGPILAAGLSYQALFATFAALWVTFSLAGLLIQSNPALQEALFGILESSVPGLIKNGAGDGVVDPSALFETGVLTVTGAFSLLGLLVSALGWLASGRDSVRAMFLSGPLERNFLLLKLQDLALAIAFGLALLVSAALTVLSTAALSIVFDWFGINEASYGAISAGRIGALFIVLLLDTVVLALFFRFVSGIPIPPRRLLGGSLLGAFALGVLKVLGSTLLGGASSNPLLASFAVIIGLLIWFNFICQVILLAASWIAIGMADRGIIADPALEARRIDEERAEEARIREEVLAELEHAPRPGFFARLVGRRR
jgi:membrane protein